MNISTRVRIVSFIVNGGLLAAWIYHIRNYNTFIPDTWLIVSLPVGACFFHISILRPGSTHDMLTLLKQYFYQSLFYVIGLILQLRLKYISLNTQEQQKRLLSSILTENQNTKCVKLFGINVYADVEEYRSKLPLTTYNDYTDLASEVANYGSEGFMFPGKADYIALTSGTVSGESHMFPKKTDILKRKTGVWVLLAQKLFLEIPGNQFVRKWLTVTIASRLRQSASGITMGPISSIASRMSVSISMYVTPQHLLDQITCEASAIYVFLVFGLGTDDIKNLFFPTATTALVFFKTLEREWRKICDDVENGFLDYNLAIDESVRQQLNAYIKQDNKIRAEFLRIEFNKGMKGIAARIWPKCAGLFCAATGSYFVQARYVKSEYLGHLPMFSPFHAGTESLYGMNLHLMDDDITYVTMTPYNFFEFIPLDDVGERNPRTVLAHEVKVGSQYEMVVTTWEGLYRYRTGDIIEIAQWYGTIPRYKFIRRSGDVLSAGSERVPERIVSTAVQLAAEKWNQSVYDMTSVESIHVETLNGHVSEKPYYIVFLQLHDQNSVLNPEQKLMVDAELCKLHEIYGTLRSNEKFHPIKVIQLHYGTLDKVKEVIMDANHNISYAQYKQPRIMRREHLLRLLLDNEINPVPDNTWS